MHDIYRALSDPTRRKILQLLGQEGFTQSDLTKHFTISQPAITKHLKILLEEGFITQKRRGKYTCYKLDLEALESTYLLMRREIEAMLDRKLYSLKKHLEQEKGDYTNEGDH